MNRIILMAAASLTLFTMGCAPAETCSAFATTGTKCANVQACCTTTACRYTATGKEWKCDGTNCTAAATQLATDCQ